ncbi:signal peptidase II [Actinoplanes sp. NPDC049802]|uniref:signal peptidase II n=1 Tax=Actinoplanes sp. NPDC049802 TaxID=3154742 RepID=UPI0033D60C17
MLRVHVGFRLVSALAAFVIVADQLSKFWAVEALTGRAPVAVVGDLIELRLIYNPGAAFSVAAGSTWLLTLVTAVAVIALGVAAVRVRSRGWAVALGLLLGGAVTHLADRLLREPGPGRGHVVDFIDYFGFFVGNVADIALVAGAGLAVLLQLRGVTLTGATEFAKAGPAAG